MQMYDLLLTLHSYLRWGICVLACIVIVKAMMGISQKNPFTAQDGKFGLFFMISCDIQLLLGLLLYFWASPITTAAFADMGTAMKNSETRFWAVEHLTMMLVAWLLVHIGRAKSKKGSDDSRHKNALIFYGIAVLLIIISIIMAHRPLFR